MNWMLPASRPDRWFPANTMSMHHPPEPGRLVAYDHAVWRVIEVNPVPADLWTEHDHQAVRGVKPAYRNVAEPAVVVIRPVQITSDDVKARNHDKHLRHHSFTTWYVYQDEHYPVCALCGEPPPCRERMGQRFATRELDRMTRFENPGVCPACEEPVTGRQKSLTFADNMEIPAGPPVTFHLRGKCWTAAAQYEQQWVQADPTQRRATLSCAGHITNHNDGTYECTELANCSGPAAIHPSYASCDCSSCNTQGRFNCKPSPTARQAGTA